MTTLDFEAVARDYERIAAKCAQAGDYDSAAACWVQAANTWSLAADAEHDISRRGELLLAKASAFRAGAGALDRAADAADARAHACTRGVTLPGVVA